MDLFGQASDVDDMSKQSIFIARFYERSNGEDVIEFKLENFGEQEMRTKTTPTKISTP